MKTEVKKYCIEFGYLLHNDLTTITTNSKCMIPFYNLFYDSILQFVLTTVRGKSYYPMLTL